ncbi:PTS transporter subunit EIIB [Serratia silvae]
MIEQILLLVGGSKNIIICGNCMTRLRLTLKDRHLFYAMYQKGLLATTQV